MKKVRIQIRSDASSYSKVGCWSILKKQAAEFCSNTGLHGYKYISQTERPKAERIIWAITVLSSLCCAIVLMNMSWNYYASRPTLTVIESTHYGIWNYPFPAITVCNINRISYNLTKEFVKNLKTPPNMSKEFLIQEMRLINELLIPGTFGHDVQKNLTRLQYIIDDNRMSILDVVKLISQNCSTLLRLCRWKGTLDRCDRFFKQSFSRDGMCCSFNYYIFPEITEEKYEHLFYKEILRYRHNTENLMQRSASCGFETGMSMIINGNPDDYHATILGAYGIKVMVHHPFNYPDFNAEMQLVQLNSEHFVSINPSVMYSKPEVKNLAVSTRKCIFTDEANKILYSKVKARNLTFATYSYHNCIAECRVTFTKIKCGCIPYYFPQNSTRICNLRDVQCLKRYKSIFDTSWPMSQHDQNLSKSLQELSSIKKGPCGCIPDCSLHHYSVESSFGTLDPTLYFNEEGFSKNPRNATSMRNHSIIHVFFNDLVAFQYRQSVNYSWRNLFASFGGLLGLFAGFSLMSIFEFLYFFVIRTIIEAYFNSTKHRNVQ
ncbi:sodium channel protein Nach-like [Nylanderia fulva]|uniref:sodium channel protein Nach-like n=1 Tax=Nylanderia fulva TaxID=613905 RepID=UPI0010FAD0F3|nr:sodium channel protein Nach-like [Nylanderia fulva]